MILIRLKILQITFKSLIILILRLRPPSCRESEQSLRIWLGGKMASKLSMALHSFQKSPGKEFNSWQMLIGHVQICDCFPAPSLCSSITFPSLEHLWGLSHISVPFCYILFLCFLKAALTWKFFGGLRTICVLTFCSTLILLSTSWHWSVESETDPEKWYIPQLNWVPAFHEAVFAVLTHLLEKSIKLPSWVRLKFTRVLNEWNDPNS